MPMWRIPQNVAQLAEDGDGVWEDRSWAPILLRVLTGTSYCGREIPLAWEIEIEPSDDAFGLANGILETQGIDPDGEGWAQAIQDAMSLKHPKLADRLHLSDSDFDFCIIWVEDEETCRNLIKVAWDIIFDK